MSAIFAFGKRPPKHQVSVLNERAVTPIHNTLPVLIGARRLS